MAETTAPTLAEQIALVKRIAHLWPYHASEADRQTMIAAGKSLEAQPARDAEIAKLNSARAQDQQRLFHYERAIDRLRAEKKARDAVIDAARKLRTDLYKAHGVGFVSSVNLNDLKNLKAALAALPPAPDRGVMPEWTNPVTTNQVIAEWNRMAAETNESSASTLEEQIVIVKCRISSLEESDAYFGGDAYAPERIVWRIILATLEAQPARDAAIEAARGLMHYAKTAHSRAGGETTVLSTRFGILQRALATPPEES